MAAPRIETAYLVNRIAPLKLALLCLATALLSCNAPEAELNAAPAAAADNAAFVSKFRCESDGRCSWQLVPSNTAKIIVVKSDLVDLLTSVLASILVYFANESNMPYCYLPWLAFSLKAFLTIQGPTILSLGQNIILSRSVAASCFYLICIFVTVQQISVWCDVLQIFCRVWRYYIRHLSKERLSFKKDEMS